MFSQLHGCFVPNVILLAPKHTHKRIFDSSCVRTRGKARSAIVVNVGLQCHVVSVIISRSGCDVPHNIRMLPRSAVLYGQTTWKNNDGDDRSTTAATSGE